MSWSREDKLLLLCCRTEMDEETKDTLNQIVSDNLNWDYILQKASIQGIAPLLYYNLKDRAASPGKIKERTRQIYYNNATRNILLLSELGRVLEAFNKVKTPVVVLKGAALLKTVYSNIALRPLVDIDLLVHQEDLARIKEELRNLGYRLNRSDYQISLERFGSELGFTKEGQVFLEIHWDLAQYERFKKVVQIDSDALWETAKTCKIADVDALILSPEYLIFSLCIHLSLVHSFGGLMWLCDLREVLKFYKKEIDWKYIVEKAQEFRIKTALYYCLYFSHRLLDASFPLEILQGLEPLRIKKKLLKFFRSEDCNLRGNRHIEQLLLMDKTGDIFRVLLKVLFPSQEWLKYRYSITVSWKIYLYRILHPFVFSFNSAFHK